MRFKDNDNVKYYDTDEHQWFYGYITDDADDGFYEIWDDDIVGYVYVHQDNIVLDNRKRNLDLL